MSIERLWGTEYIYRALMRHQAYLPSTCSVPSIFHERLRTSGNTPPSRAPRSARQQCLLSAFLLRADRSRGSRDRLAFLASVSPSGPLRNIGMHRPWSLHRARLSRQRADQAPAQNRSASAAQHPSTKAASCWVVLPASRYESCSECPILANSSKDLCESPARRQSLCGANPPKRRCELRNKRERAPIACTLQGGLGVSIER